MSSGSTRRRGSCWHLSGRQISNRMRLLGGHVGIEGLSGHSGRCGLAADLVWRGESTTAIQMAGGGKAPRMVLRYASAVRVKDGAAARGFGK